MQTALHPQSAPPIDLGRLHPVDIDDSPIVETRPIPVPVPDRLEREVANARAREAFCNELVAQRLRVGLTLDALSTATKINASLFAQLERGDLSHWPRGIYRRAFFREYAAAIGLESDEAMTRFQELFPDLATPAAAGVSVNSIGRNTLRLTLAPDAAPGPMLRPSFAAAAGIDAAIVVGLAGVVAQWFGGSFFVALGLIATTYSTLGTALAGRSPASWWIGQGTQRQQDREIRRALRVLVPTPRQD